MRRSPTLLWLALVVSATVTVPPAGAQGPVKTRTRAASQSRLASLRLPFIDNLGQVDGQVAYYAPTFAGTVFVTHQGELVYSLPRGVFDVPAAHSEASASGWSLTERFTASDTRPRPIGESRALSRVGHFRGNDPARWRPFLSTYEELALGEVRPGVTVSLRARGHGVEKVFTVKPGASIDRIRVVIDGAESLSVDGAGGLVVRTGLGAVTFTAPLAYQERDGKRRDVTVAYRVSGREYGFAVGDHDRRLPLVIDPVLQSTYLGGEGAGASALAVHPATGDVYVAGTSAGADFPGTAGGAQTSSGGATAYVARLNGALTALVQATYVGDASSATALAIDAATGDVYVAGRTTSGALAGSGGGAQPGPGGLSDGFVARLSGTLTQLLQATYLGGRCDDTIEAILVHPVSGDVYVAGSTDSPDLPRVGGGAQPLKGAGADAFVARLNHGLTGLIQATYLGGDGDDRGYALALSPATGDVYVAGETLSTNFPGTGGGAQAAAAGSGDAFVARLGGALTALAQATYFGGGGADAAHALAVAPDTGDVYLAGRTDSLDLPGTTAGAQATNGGAAGTRDAFVARMNAGLTALPQATYLGGPGDEVAFALAVAPDTGDVYAAGRTSSARFLAAIGDAQPAVEEQSGAFVARLPRTLAALAQVTYLGGGGGGPPAAPDGAHALAIAGPLDGVYVAGVTVSADLPAAAGGAQSAKPGGPSAPAAFVARLTSVEPRLDRAAADGGPDLKITKVHTGGFARGQVGATYTLTVSNVGGGPTSGGTVTVTDTLPAGLTATALAGGGWTCTLATVTCTRSDALATGSSYPALTLTVDVGASAAHRLVNTATVIGGGDTNLTNNAASDPTAVASFVDVSTTHGLFAWIEALYGASITGGCGAAPPQYCPDGPVTRAQMAVFLLRGIHGLGYLPPPATGMFTDVPISGPSAHPLARWIEQLAREGITSGCGPSTYCPEGFVTRGQMAVFLLRAEHGGGYQPPAATGMFADVPISGPSAHPFAKWIEQLAREGITGGCASNPLRYCPDVPVTRGQMAVFLVRTFHLNRAPLVSAGAVSTTIAVTAAASLTGTVSDDGLPSPPGTVVTTWSKLSGPGGVTFADASALATTATFSSEGPYVLRLTAFDGQLTSTADVGVTVTAPASGQLPSDPSTLAPPHDPGVAATVGRGTEFLYTGPNPVQRGVAPGTIDATRATVLRGRVRDGAGAPLPGVTIGVLDHPEFGQTFSRSDGMFDMVVNGGGSLTVTYARAGLLPAQRTLSVPWQDWVVAPDVILLPLDPALTAIALNAASMQVARGSVMTDADGTRRATLLFPAGTTATLVMPDDSTRPLASLHVRATEYTVGPGGDAAMPAGLPSSSAYTYALEFSADEAVIAGAKRVDFNQLVTSYVENVLGFPVGIAVPMGFYDRGTGTWQPAASGRVVQITAISGGLATVDTVGGGSLPPLALGADERQQLASLYSVGQALWRVPVTHFTPWDKNWGFGPPPDAEPPNQPKPDDDTQDDSCGDPSGGGGGYPGSPSDDRDCGNLPLPRACAAGSLIGCQEQTLGEAVDVVGTPYRLHYDSFRVPGRVSSRTLRIRLTGALVPLSLKRIDREIRVAGRVFANAFNPSTNLFSTFTWDGLDAYGRAVQGRQRGLVRIGYVYDGSYQQTDRFGYNGNGAEITGSKTRREITLWQDIVVGFGAWDARGQGLGGWTLSAHHAYDPVGQVLYLGTGRRRDASLRPPVISTVAGGKDSYNVDCVIHPEFCVDGIDATTTKLTGPLQIALDALGSLYIAEAGDCRVRKVSRSGAIGTVAGVTETKPWGQVAGVCGSDNGKLNNPSGVAVDDHGNMYVADTGNFRILKYGPGGVTTVAGTGSPQGSCGAPPENVPAASTALCGPTYLALDGQGNLYFQDGIFHLRKIDASGLISSIGPLSPRSPTLDNQGRLHFLLGDETVRRLEPDGTMTLVAGGGTGTDEGILATQAKLCGPTALAFDRSDNLYITQGSVCHRVRVVSPAGIIRTFAGAGGGGIGGPDSGDGGPAIPASVCDPWGVAVDSTGDVYIGERCGGAVGGVRRVTRTLPGFSAGQIVIASEDGGQLYVFDEDGRHQQTLHALTGAMLHQFTHDGANRLVQVTDGDGNVTTVQRDGSGHPTAIVGPFGQQTNLALNGDGFLSGITDPAAQAHQFTYTSGGLMTGLTNPRGQTYSFLYDSLGRLAKDTDPAGGFKALARIDQDVDAFTVTLTTALGRTDVYQALTLPSGDRQKIDTDPAGLQAQVVNGVNGVDTRTVPDGTVRVETLTGDPRWGMQAPLAKTTSVTTPGALSRGSTFERTVTLSDAADLLSLTGQTDTFRLNGQPFTSDYTAATRTFTATTPLGRQATRTIDTRGRTTQRQLGSLDPSSFTYDSHGRLSAWVAGTGGSARTFSFAYNPQGYLASVTDPLSRTASFSYDAAGRMIQKTLPDGSVIGYAHDANGNLTSLTPPGRPAHTFAFTPVDLTSTYTAPNVGVGNQTLYAYNADRQLTTITRPDSQTLTFAYDTAGRLGTLTTPDGAYGYSYGGVTGNLTGITAPGGPSLAYTYDGSLLTGTTWTGAVAGSVSRTFDSFFRTASEGVNGGNTVNFQYDNDGLLTAAGSLTLARSAQTGLVTGTTLGNVTDTLGYNGFGEMTSYGAAYNATGIFATQYTYDKLGRITQKVETVLGTPTTFDYAYDLAGRLSQVKQNTVVVSTYTYDANGNRLSGPGLGTPPTYDNQDRLLQYGSTTYAYTPNGELASQTTGGPTTTYQYDVLGNLRHVGLPGGTAIDYVIDGRNRRIGKKVNGTLVQGFLYDGLRAVAELDGGNAIVSRFVHGSRGGAPEYMIKGGVTYRIIADHLGSVRLVIDVATGTVAQRLDYDEFGKIVTDTNPGFQPFGFAGGLYDGASALIRFGARDYDPATGRWTTKDPIRFSGRDTNLYRYGFGDPINGTDPTGLAYGYCGINLGAHAHAAAGGHYGASGGIVAGTNAQDFFGVQGYGGVNQGHGGGVSVGIGGGVEFGFSPFGTLGDVSGPSVETQGHLSVPGVSIDVTLSAPVGSNGQPDLGKFGVGFQFNPFPFSLSMPGGYVDVGGSYTLTTPPAIFP